MRTKVITPARFKFRAWDLNEKELIDADILVSEGYCLALNGTGIISTEWEPSGIKQLSTSSLILSQYIGVQDSRGKEIYEGDIILRYWSDVEIDRGTVEWSETELSWIYVKNDGSGYKITKTMSKKIQIVGNIYESLLQNPTINDLG